MAFQPANIALFVADVQTSDSFLTRQFQPPQVWTYITGDSIASVSGSQYFRLLGPNAFNFSPPRLRVGDLIWASCGDGNVQLQVTDLSPDVTTSPYSSGGG